MAPTNPLSLQPLPLREGRALPSEFPREFALRNPRDGEESTSRSFLETLQDSIQQVNKLQDQADKAISDLITGEDTDVARTMIAVQKANLSFQMMAQVRNKIVQAYQDVMRMPV